MIFRPGMKWSRYDNGRWGWMAQESCENYLVDCSKWDRIAVENLWRGLWSGRK